MDNQVQARIASLLQPKLDELNCFVVEVVFNPANNKIEVFIDSLETISISQCTTISRHLEFFLDHDDAISEKYTLEVSSPGVGSPFKVEQQYQKHIGKEVEIKLLDGSNMIGLLRELNDTTIVIDKEIPAKKKHLKPTHEPTVIQKNEIKETTAALAAAWR